MGGHGRYLLRHDHEDRGPLDNIELANDIRLLDNMARERQAGVQLRPGAGKGRRAARVQPDQPKHPAPQLAQPPVRLTPAQQAQFAKATPATLGQGLQIVSNVIQQNRELRDASRQDPVAKPRAPLGSPADPVNLIGPPDMSGEAMEAHLSRPGASQIPLHLRPGRPAVDLRPGRPAPYGKGDPKAYPKAYFRLPGEGKGKGQKGNPAWQPPHAWG